MPHKATVNQRMVTERIVVARLAYKMGNAFRDAWYGIDTPLSSVADEIRVGMAVLIEHGEGRVAGVKAVANIAGMSPATAHRKLNQLVDVGVLVREGRGYAFDVSRVDEPKRVQAFEKLYMELRAAVAALDRIRKTA